MTTTNIKSPEVQTQTSPPAIHTADPTVSDSPSPTAETTGADPQAYSLIEQSIVGQAMPAIMAASTFDLNDIALPQNFAALADVKTEAAAPAIRKPGKQTWFAPHPEQKYWRSFLVLNDEEDRGSTYVISPTLKDVLGGEWVAKILVPCQTRQGSIFFWPIKLPDADGKLDPWNRSALGIATSSPNEWIRVKSNMEAGAYEASKPVTPPAAPTWGDGIDGHYQKALAAVFIDSLTHPILKRLRGEI